MIRRREVAPGHEARLSPLARALRATAIGAVLAIALSAPGGGLAARLDAAGLLWEPEGETVSAPLALVVVLHDSAGIDARGWPYGEQITAAGIAVLHVEPLATSADGFVAPAAADDGTMARARLATVLGLIAMDERFAGAPVGLLALGSAGQAALLAAADAADGDRIAGLALLYPGCADLAAAVTDEARPRSPILLLHGDADPANPAAACIGLADRLARSAPVQRNQYAGVGYAWDVAPHGSYERVRLPWPGRPGRLLDVRHAPEAAELAAAQVAAFFAASFVAYRQ
jgi:dienelactone hydrolase